MNRIPRAGANRELMSHLTQLGQHPLAALRMHKRNAGAVRAKTGRRVDHPGATGFQRGYGRLNIINLVGDMMDAGTVLLLPEYRHPTFSVKRFVRVTSDGFFISVSARDPKFDSVATKALHLTDIPVTFVK